MLAAGHGIVSKDPVSYITTVSGILATWVIAYFRWIKPRAAAHKVHEVERAGLRAEVQRLTDTRNQVIDGMPEVPGMTPAVPPLAIRLRLMESDILVLQTREGEIPTSG